MTSLPGSNRLLHAPQVESHCRILVLGVGGAGCNSITRMLETWKDKPDTAALNTDLQSLAACAAARCVQIGAQTTRGLGAAGDPTTGRLAAEESVEQIHELLATCDLAVLVGGLGGGTGTGALPIVAQIARRAGALTLAFATMPFAFEGERKRLAAEEGLRTLQQTADAVVCMPNDRLLEMVGEGTALEEAFRVSDGIVASGIHAMWSLLSHTGVINLDFADVRELFERSGGVCGFSYAEGTGPARASAVLQNLLACPLLQKGRRISEASGVLLNIAGGPDLTLADVQGIMGRIASMVRPNARIFHGVMVNQGWRERIALTVLVTENWLEGRDGKVPSRETLHGTGGEENVRKPVPGEKEAEQAELQFEQGNGIGRGRFEKVEPTFHQGQDLGFDAAGPEGHHRAEGLVPAGAQEHFAAAGRLGHEHHLPGLPRGQAALGQAG